MIRFKKNIILYIIILGFFFPSSGLCQSLIKGSLYLYDKKEPAIGCSVIVTDSIKTDSIVPKNLIGTEINTLSDIDGNFEINNLKDCKIDLLVSVIGYHNTIVKNIPLDNDTVQLNGLPLFIYDYILNETRAKEVRNFLGIKRKGRLKMIHYIHGTEGPFTYNDKLMVSCDNSGNVICCKRTKFGIEIDYNEIKTCGNNVYTK